MDLAADRQDCTMERWLEREFCFRVVSFQLQ